MNFVHSDLGQLTVRSIVVVELDTAAIVKLMDDSNFRAYQRGQQHRFFGGQAKRSPVRLSVPATGHWHLALDLGGATGTIRSSVRVVPPA